jgi:hypothetical protein
MTVFATSSLPLSLILSSSICKKKKTGAFLIRGSAVRKGNRVGSTLNHLVNEMGPKVHEWFTPNRTVLKFRFSFITYCSVKYLKF